MNRLKKNYPERENINIKKMIDTSLIDWEGMIVTTLYVGGCNFRCPFCYNTDLVLSPGELPTITNKEILSALRGKKGFLDGICLSGGEPTLFNDLAEFLQLIKNEGIKVKLDTNGSNPEMLKTLLTKGLVDYIAMDIKNCLNLDDYTKTIGIYKKQIIKTVKTSISLIMDSDIDYEFRTTVIPGFHSVEAIESIAREIQGAKKYILQNFLQSEKMLDPNMTDIKPYSDEKMKNILKKVDSLVMYCGIR